MISISYNKGLKLNPSKTAVYMESIDSTGFTITQNGLIPSPRITTKLLRFPYDNLRTKSDWQTFEGMIIFLNEYIVDLSEELMILRNLMVNKQY